MAAWPFLGCEHTVGGESGSLQGEGGFGGPWQVGFGQPGSGFLDCWPWQGCFALLVSPWPSCPSGHFCPLETPLAHGRAALPPVSNLWWQQRPVPAWETRCWAGPLWKASSAWCHQFCGRVPAALGEAVPHLGCAVQHLEFVGLAFSFPTWRRQGGPLPSKTPFEGLLVSPLGGCESGLPK